MRLYYHPLSTFSRRVRMQLVEKGVSIEEHVVDMTKREHKGPEFGVMNPYGRVPVLVDGGFVLYESSAIMEYLEAVFPAVPLVPKEPRGRALVAMHVKLCDLELAIHTGTLFFPRRFLPRERWDLATQEKAIDQIAKHLAVLDAQLKGHQYLVGGAFSLADLAYIPFLEFLPLFGLQAPDNVAAWSARISARPSAQQTKPSK